MTMYTAFIGTQRYITGAPGDVARALAEKVGINQPDTLVFDSEGRQVDLDLRGGADEAAARYANPEPPRKVRGRPKLGVVGREITLLPRHWAWLDSRPGGASAALRRLVDEARGGSATNEDRRSAQDAAYRFMNAIAGNLENFEDVTRALYAHDDQRFKTLTAAWPDDIRRHALGLAGFA